MLNTILSSYRLNTDNTLLYGCKDIYSIIMSNNNQKEYIDIPLNIQQTPTQLYQNCTEYSMPPTHIEIGLDLISRIDTAIRQKEGTTQLTSLYLNYYAPANTTKFLEKEWPASHEIQAQFQDKDFNAKVQNIYNELRLRNIFQKLVKNPNNERFLQISEQIWQTYESIFERQSKEINFHPVVAWEIIESFLYQFRKYHEIVNAQDLKDKAEKYVFDIEGTKKILKTSIKNIPTELSKTYTSKQYFGYFSLICLATIEVYSGKYKEALEIISRISITDLAIYSKSIGALLTLYETAVYAYFMQQQYKESARVAEMILMFYQKNKKYFSKVNGQRIITRQVQNLAELLCLNYIFLQEKPKSIITEIFKSTNIKYKDRQHRQKLSDKYVKLRQNDISAVTRLIQHCSAPSIFSKAQETQELILNRFKKLQKITLNTILQHYTQISITKIASMLNLTEEEVNDKIESFNNISTGTALWDRTIMQPLLNQTRKVHVEIIDNIVKLDTDETNANEGFNEWQQYKQEVRWLIEKVNAL